MTPDERRAAVAAGVPDIALAYAEAYRCPDCNSESSLHVEGGVPVLDIAHDDTCPTTSGRGGAT